MRVRKNIKNYSEQFCPDQKFAVVFTHIAKTGGITFLPILNNLLDIETEYKINNIVDWHQLDRENKTYCLPEKSLLIHGHKCMGIEDVLDEDRLIYPLTFLRDPVKTFMSQYVFIRRYGFTRKSITDWLEKAPANPFTKFIGGGSLSLAKEMLESYYFTFGITERYNESLSLLMKKFNIDTDINYTLQNTSGSSEMTLNDSLTNSIIEKNKDDMNLYSYACRLFDERIKDSGILGSLVQQERTLKQTKEMDNPLFEKGLSTVTDDELRNKINQVIEEGNIVFNSAYFIFINYEELGDTENAKKWLFKCLDLIRDTLPNLHSVLLRFGEYSKSLAFCELVFEMSKEMNITSPVSHLKDYLKEVENVYNKIPEGTIADFETKELLQNKLDAYSKIHNIDISLGVINKKPENQILIKKHLKIVTNHLDKIDMTPPLLIKLCQLFKSMAHYKELTKLISANIDKLELNRREYEWMYTDMVESFFLNGDRDEGAKALSEASIKISEKNRVSIQELEKLRSLGTSEDPAVFFKSKNKVLILRMGQVFAMDELLKQINSSAENVSVDILMQKNVCEYAEENWKNTNKHTLPAGHFIYKNVRDKIDPAILTKHYDAVIILASLKYIPGLGDVVKLASSLNTKTTAFVPVNIYDLAESRLEIIDFDTEKALISGVF